MILPLVVGCYLAAAAVVALDLYRQRPAYHRRRGYRLVRGIGLLSAALVWPWIVVHSVARRAGIYW